MFDFNFDDFINQDAVTLLCGPDPAPASDPSLLTAGNIHSTQQHDHQHPPNCSFPLEQLRCGCALCTSELFGPPLFPDLPPARPESNSTRSSHTLQHSNEASPYARPQEMEGGGAGALAAQAAPLQSHPHTTDHFDRMLNADMDISSNDLFHYGHQQPVGTLDTPGTSHFNPFQPSHVRESGEEPLVSSPTSADAATAANILANTNNGLHATGWANDLPPFVSAAGPSNQEDAALERLLRANHLAQFPEQAQWADDPQVDEEQPDVKAYAKLAFADGDYYVTTFEVIVGRDMDFWRREMKREKQQRRAEEAVEVYRQEPSQPSQPGDGDDNLGPSSKSSQSLEGRPAKALASNFSEQGGAVSYAADDDAEARRSKRKRKTIASKSSSTTSVVPAVLHPTMMGNFTHANPFSAEAGAVVDQASHAFVPVHPTNAQDIRLISKEHLLFRYNFEEELWEMEVLGTSATINDRRYERGSIVQLSHHDRIAVTSLELEFKLPDAENGSPGPSRGTFASDTEDSYDDNHIGDGTPIRTSPVRHLSNAIAAGDSEEEEEAVAPKGKRPKKKSGIKLSLSKKRKAQKEDEVEEPKDKEKPAKKQKKKESSTEQSPEAVKKPEKGKKPKTADKEPAKTIMEVKEEIAEKLDKEDKPEKEEKISPSAQPINLEPGSIFEGIAPEHLPQKRKGPGRPPKNGLISKRDQSFVKRKQKEYEKRGIAPPPFDQMVAEVRAENKQKEAAAKAQARGEAVPEMAIMQSIETDVNLRVAKPDAVPTIPTDQNTSATPLEPVRRPSPKPKRIVKSPSPMKPESEYTEEELKKPTMTYVHILDDVLREHPTGKADLQELYDRVCKRYPYFKYKTGTSGWQSSVRHNLLQHDRFVEDGRSGKGRLWTINFKHTLEKEKKRNRTPPPRPFPQMPPYGAPGYNGPYGQPQTNARPQPGAGSYYSPYAASYPGQRPPYGPPPGQHGAPPMAETGQPYGAMPGPPSQTPHAQYPPYGTAPSHTPQPTPQQQPPAQFAGIVGEIMGYRSKYLSQLQAESEAFKEYDKMFSKVTNFHSETFHGRPPAERPQWNEAEQLLSDDLEAIFTKHKHLSTQPGGESSTVESAAAGGQGVAGAGGSGGVGQAVDDAAERRTAAGAESVLVTGQVPAPAEAPAQLSAQSLTANAVLPAVPTVEPTVNDMVTAQNVAAPVHLSMQAPATDAHSPTAPPAEQQSLQMPVALSGLSDAAEQIAIVAETALETGEGSMRRSADEQGKDDTLVVNATHTA